AFGPARHAPRLFAFDLPTRGGLDPAEFEADRTLAFEMDEHAGLGFLLRREGRPRDLALQHGMLRERGESLGIVLVGFLGGVEQRFERFQALALLLRR